MLNVPTAIGRILKALPGPPRPPAPAPSLRVTVGNAMRCETCDVRWSDNQGDHCWCCGREGEACL